MAKSYPDAKQTGLGKQTQPPMQNHLVVCVHTMDGYLASTREMFAQGGYAGLESHYGMGGAWGSDVAPKLDGVVDQFQNRSYTADANLDGNPYVISIETADNAPTRSSDTKRWTAKQAASLVDLLVWECSMAAHADCPSGFRCRTGIDWQGIKVAIPPVLIVDTKPGRYGLAYHRQGVEHSEGVGAVPGYLVRGGVRWSKSIGKECPSDARVAQFTKEIIPAVQAAIKGANDMPTPKEIADAVWLDDVITDDLSPLNPTISGITALHRMTNKLDEVRDHLNDANDAISKQQAIISAQGAKIDQILALVTPAPKS